MTDLGWPQFQSLARNVAGELGARRAETWTVAAWHENPVRPAATLEGPGSARLFIHYGVGGADKITVTGLLPEGTYAGRGFTANVDPARGARAIAQAADTRVLRAGYLDILPGKVTQKQANDGGRAARDTAAAQAAALFEVPAPEDGTLYLGRFVSGSGVARFGPGGESVSVQLDGLPLETALRILSVLATDTNAACCYSLGPGHHPDLSTVGCLREDAERGHDASRQRIIRLLSGHRIDAVRAGQLLDAAYRNDHWGSQDENTGITTDYDRNYGEFTVQVPRREQTTSPPASAGPRAVSIAMPEVRRAATGAAAPREEAAAVDGFRRGDLVEYNQEHWTVAARAAAGADVPLCRTPPGGVPLADTTTAPAGQVRLVTRNVARTHGKGADIDYIDQADRDRKLARINSPGVPAVQGTAVGRPARRPSKQVPRQARGRR